jgi:hypothetical protein
LHDIQFSRRESEPGDDAPHFSPYRGAGAASTGCGGFVPRRGIIASSINSLICIAVLMVFISIDFQDVNVEKKFQLYTYCLFQIFIVSILINAYILFTACLNN